MAETASTMLPLGTPAPTFELLEVRSWKKLSLEDLKSPLATVIMFICNHCPYVQLILPQLITLAIAYQQQGIHFIAISSNDAIAYPADGPGKMREEALEKNLPFPYLYDETQAIARAYHAACTPDFYIFDANLRCVYRGRFDEATPGNGKEVTGKDLTNALESILAGNLISPEQKPSVGCNIKWKK